MILSSFSTVHLSVNDENVNISSQSLVSSTQSSGKIQRRSGIWVPETSCSSTDSVYAGNVNVSVDEMVQSFDRSLGIPLDLSVDRNTLHNTVNCSQLPIDQFHQNRTVGASFPVAASFHNNLFQPNSIYFPNFGKFGRISTPQQINNGESFLWEEIEYLQIY